MKVGIGIYIEKRMVGKGDMVSIPKFKDGTWLDLTSGKDYEVKGISQTNNLLIENNSGVTKEYATVFFQ